MNLAPPYLTDAWRLIPLLVSVVTVPDSRRVAGVWRRDRALQPGLLELFRNSSQFLIRAAAADAAAASRGSHWHRLWCRPELDLLGGRRHFLLSGAAVRSTSRSRPCPVLPQRTTQVVVMVAVVLVVVLLQPTWDLPTAFTEGVHPQLLESCLQLFENWTMLQLLLIHGSINMPRVLSFHFTRVFRARSNA